MSTTVQYIINVVGNAEEVINDISQASVSATSNVTSFSESMSKIRDAGLAFETVSNMFGKLTAELESCTAANNVQREAETRLEQVMRNTMGASNEEIQSIKDLASAQQQLGIVGDEVQLAGAQELGTYVAKKDTLAKLIPAMNDMIAQQYGFNASQESAVNIATMMGKVMEGQVGALSRYGYSFDEAQEQILKFGTEEEKAATLAEVIGQAVGGVNEALAATPEGKMKQVANNMGDLQERVGSLWVRIKSGLMPTVEKAVSLAGDVIGFLEEHDTVFGAVAAAIATIAVVTKGWVVVQGILNTVLSMNPVGLVVMAVVALVAAITYVISRTEGWGETWHNVTEYCKLSFQQMGEFLRLKWLQIADFFMTGFETIETGWYRLKSLWDDESASEGLLRIQEDRDRRAKEIAAAKEKVDELAEAREKMDVWEVQFKAGKNLSGVADDIKSKLGINSQLIAAVNNNETETNNNSETNATTNAIATGGTRNTQITINLGKMADITFNGGVGENAENLKSQLEEILLRILYSAQSA